MAISKLALMSLILFSVTGCMSDIQTILEGADAVCVEANVDGPYTDSGASGRGIKVPEGTPITQETVDALCP